MPAINIDSVTVDNGELKANVTYQNDLPQPAEVSGTLGVSGSTFQFGPAQVSPNTTKTVTFRAQVNDAIIGETAFFTVSLSEPGVNTGEYPAVDEQRQVKITSSGADLGEPEFEGGGTIDGSSPSGNGDGFPTRKAVAGLAIAGAAITVLRGNN